MPRLGIISPVGGLVGGAETALQRLLPELPAGSVDLVCLGEGVLPDIARAAGHTATVIEAGRLRQPHRLAAAVRAVRHRIRSQRWEAGLSWMPKGHLYLAPAALGTGVATLWFQHGVPDPPSAMDRWVSRLPADAGLACSAGAARAQRRLTPTLPIRVAYPPIDGAGGFSDPSNPPRRWSDRPFVVTVGRLDPQKAHDVAIDVISRLRGDLAVDLAIVGPVSSVHPEHQRSLEALIYAKGLADRVRLVGYDPHPGRWLRSADVVLQIARGESFGLAVVEAMAAGAAVVAAAEGGPMEIVTDGTDGCLVDPVDPAAIADAVAGLLADPALRARLGAAARLRAATFTPAAFAAEVRAAVATAVDRGISVDRYPAVRG